ncbi:hypothetical protein, partial [Bacillus cereus]
MSEIVPAAGGSSGKKGKLSKNQKMLFFGGGLAVIGFFLVMSRGKSSSSSSEQEEIPDYLTNYPTLGPQNALMNDQMNALIGHQEEMMNSLLEATGKKPPSEVYQYRSGDYADEASALKMQSWLIGQGISSTTIEKFRSENGWAGDRTYYAVKGYTADQEMLLDVSKNAREKGYTV